MSVHGGHICHGCHGGCPWTVNWRTVVYFVPVVQVSRVCTVLTQVDPGNQYVVQDAALQLFNRFAYAPFQVLKNCGIKGPTPVPFFGNYKDKVKMVMPGSI